MAVIGDLVVNLTANSQRFSRGIKNAGNAVAGFATRATKQIATVGAAFAGLAIGKGIKEAFNLETLQLQFEILLGSMEQAESMMAQIRKFGAETPFETADIAKSAKALLGAGVASDDVISQLKVMGNMAALAGTNVSELATIFAQVKSKGSLTGERLLQFQERLVPVTAAVAQHFGILESEVNDFVSQGKVGYDDLVTALNNVEINGNRLDNMMERQSKTGAGLWSTVKDGINQALAELGKFILEQFKVKEAMQAFSEFMTGTFIPVFKRISENWQAMWDLMVSGAALQLVRIMEDVKHFGVQVASVAEFIWKSMVGAFETIGDAAGTMFANIAAGNFEDPLEGFQSQLGKAVLELPERTESELERELGKQFDAAAAKFGDGFAKEFQNALPDLGDAAEDKSRIGKSKKAAEAVAGEVRDQQFAGAATRGTSEAFQSIVRNVFGRKGPGEKQLEEQKKANDKLDKNNQLLEQMASGAGVVESFA